MNVNNYNIFKLWSFLSTENPCWFVTISSSCFFFLLEPCVSLRKPKNSMIINDSTFLVDQIYLISNGCFSISILPYSGNKAADSSCCILSSFRVESVRRRRFYLPLLKVLRSWSGSSLLVPSLSHRVSGPVLRFCLSSCRTQRVFLWLLKKGVLKCIDNLQSFFNVPLGPKNLN